MKSFSEFLIVAGFVFGLWMLFFSGMDLKLNTCDKEIAGRVCLDQNGKAIKKPGGRY